MEIKIKDATICTIIDGDNTLLINMNHRISISVLLHTVKNRSHFILEEFLGTDTEKGLVKSQQGTYANQFVFSFYNEEKLRASHNNNQEKMYHE